MPNRVIRGIEFLRDAAGRATAVQIDLRRHGELWEAIYDNLLAKLREAEPRETVAEVKRSLESSRSRR